jgi:hypothetical protein
MPYPWPIAPLGPKDLTFAVKNYDFVGLTASELGPADPLLPAIDASLAEFGASVADQTLLIASMANDLTDLYAILGELATDDFQQILADLAGIAAAGDSLLNNLAPLAG